MTPTSVSMTHILPGGSLSRPPRQERQAEVAERCLFPAVSAGLPMASDHDVHRADGGVVHDGHPGDRPPENDDTLPPPDQAGGVSPSGAVCDPPFRSRCNRWRPNAVYGGHRRLHTGQKRGPLFISTYRNIHDRCIIITITKKGGKKKGKMTDRRGTVLCLCILK